MKSTMDNILKIIDALKKGLGIIFDTAVYFNLAILLCIALKRMVKIIWIHGQQCIAFIEGTINTFDYN